MASESVQYKLKVKVNNNDDTRLWRYSSPHDFNGLRSFITSTWNNDDFIAQYEDDEGDLITIASAQDLKDAFDFAVSENKKSLKIFVQSNIQQKRVQTQQQNDADSQEPAAPKKKKFNTNKEMVLDFLSNPQIIKLLPECLGAIITRLKRNNLVEQSRNLTAEQITNLIYEEIKNERYTVITSHPLYIGYAALVIPYIANRICGQQALYQHFRIDTIKQWINQLIQMLFQVLQQSEATHGCSFKDIVIDIEYPAMTDTGKVIHFGVECDLCGEYPIIGDRYKCSICEDWDCCSSCEPKHDHPLIKFKKSSRNHKNASFKGLTEIVQRLSGKPQQAEPEEKKVDNDQNVPDIVNYEQPKSNNNALNTFRPSYNFDKNGIIYWLGTKRGTSAKWTNPGIDGTVRVLSSSLLADSVPVHAAIGRETVRCVTKPEQGSWFMVDLKDIKVIPTHYTLRHYASWDTEAVRNWRLEACNNSKDGADGEWVCLLEHINDESLFGKGASNTWLIPESNVKNQSFSQFRILQFGLNSNQHHYLAMSGFEIYGNVVNEDKNGNDEAALTVDCICGSKMEQVQAKKAYKRCNTVYCDDCSEQYFNEMVFHCPNGYDPIHHANGYDLCPECAVKKVSMDEMKEKEQEMEKEEDVNPGVEVEVEVEVQPEPEPSAPDHSDAEIEDEDESEDVDEVEVEEQEEFVYAVQLGQVKEVLGIITDDMDEIIKQMLIEKKGDMTRVVTELLQ